MKLESSSAPVGSPCETLFELFSTAHGSASVGRMLKGVDTGRFVLLREARVDLSVQALAAIDVSRSLAHPRFAKLLGAIRTADCHYVASEYIPGVSLFELTLAVRKRSTTINPAVAVHLICDALKCAASAQKSLSSTAGVDYVRCIFPDTIWIAEFGDVLLTEVGVAPHLVRALEESADIAAAKDLMAAAVELFHLASGRVISAETTQKLGEYLPAPLADVLETAMGVKGKTPFATLDEFIAALSGLPEEFTASDEQVCAELARVAGPAMELRRRKLALFERGAASQSEEEEDSTKFYRTASPEKRTSNTTRPPPPDESSPTAPPVSFSALRTSSIPSFGEAPSDSELLAATNADAPLADSSAEAAQLGRISSVPSTLGAPGKATSARRQSTKRKGAPARASRNGLFNTALVLLAVAAAALLWFANSAWLQPLLGSLLKRLFAH